MTAIVGAVVLPPVGQCLGRIQSNHVPRVRRAIPHTKVAAAWFRCHPTFLKHLAPGGLKHGLTTLDAAFDKLAPRKGMFECEDVQHPVAIAQEDGADFVPALCMGLQVRSTQRHLPGLARRAGQRYRTASLTGRAVSSAGERCLDTAEVTGSIPVPPTIQISQLAPWVVCPKLA